MGSQKFGAAERVVVGAAVVGVGVVVVADAVTGIDGLVSGGTVVGCRNGVMITARVSRPSNPARSVFRQRGVWIGPR